ncbi:MAG: hypothetical protein Kow002_03260 [Anaerolineales bacterium]
MKPKLPPAKNLPRTWRNLVKLTIFSAYFYAFMEWLFFVTKPSALSILAPLDAGLVLVVTGGFFALLLVGLLLFLSLPVWLLRSPTWKPRLLAFVHIIPALMLAVTALIMVDNFTYTVFEFGIVSAKENWQRALYILGLMIGLAGFVRFATQATRKKEARHASSLALGLLTVSTIAILHANFSAKSSLTGFSTESLSPSAERPHIIILGSDGLTAGYLSAYGYGEETTPFLKSIMEISLVAENAFPNASSTTGSTTSALTGKEPAVTKVYRYPDVLHGQDTIQHLPGILRQYGYTTVQVGTPYYVDAEKINLLNSFDMINGQPVNLEIQRAFIAVLGNTPSAQFVGTLVDRVNERLRHIFYIEDMDDAVAEVNNPKIGMTDDERVAHIIELLDEAKQPLFIFAHLMNTHGPHFGTNIHRFSKDEDEGNEEKEWDKALYKDAILTFDSYLQKIFTHLEETGQLDNTILLIYTDHGYKYAVNHRIPLVIHFPEDRHAGRIKNNAQILDIPVTLMDYLGIPSPAWMTGHSLLAGEPPAKREIISIVGGSPRKVKPPFYQIKTVQVIVCHKYYQLNVQEDKWASGNLIGHTAKCEADQLPSDQEVRQKILDYLESFGYDIRSLQ